MIALGRLEMKMDKGDKRVNIMMDGIDQNIQYEILKLIISDLNISDLKDEVEKGTEMPEELLEKEFSNEDIRSGYQLFDEPLLETKEEPPLKQQTGSIKKKPYSIAKSIRVKMGVKHYQLFYICPDCGKKGKHYIKPGTPQVHCHEPSCSNVMMVRSASYNGFPEHDDWGNYYVAGDFRKSMKDKEDEESFNKEQEDQVTVHH